MLKSPIDLLYIGSALSIHLSINPETCFPPSGIPENRQYSPVNKYHPLPEIENRSPSPTSYRIPHHSSSYTHLQQHAPPPPHPAHHQQQTPHQKNNNNNNSNKNNSNYNSQNQSHTNHSTKQHADTFKTSPPQSPKSTHDTNKAKSNDIKAPHDVHENVMDAEEAAMIYHAFGDDPPKWNPPPESPAKENPPRSADKGLRHDDDSGVAELTPDEKQKLRNQEEYNQ